ncbi:RagB/SusD family nutrient uptake outer membrane protein [Pedobacter sp. SL55]|uniref:RagB/SusD family nutrient uptake outer membrane protein n=1 Tax=Pedobacter sp. SL55 TaxID=2995161 RepID=UPI00226DDDD2|nr:RagB/SusD family nutrient uptake outer membrane protein [Pedobacter sp. SL55]WAC40396.1 RagB/SusD family nutrient uptake outer membrane protein [Pedobacter sp. SL55]
MKTSFNIARLKFALVATIFLASCSKNFLEIDPKQDTNANIAVVDLPTMKAALNGIYSQLQSEDYYGRTFIVAPELLSNNGMLSVINSARYTNINLNTVVSTDTHITGLWNVLYCTAINANLLISNGEQLSFSGANLTTSRQYLGEAYALRALAYFDLVRAFAQPYDQTADASHLGVPLVLESGISKEDIAKPARNTVAEVYKSIIDDLEKAIMLFASQSPQSPSYLGLNGAKALLSRVYLYQGDWPNAERLATEVIGSGKYQLLSNTSLLSNFKVKANPEVIFEVANNTADNAGTGSLAYFCMQAGYGDMIGTEDLYNNYSATDVRRAFVTKAKRDRVGGENPAYVISKYTEISTYEENIKVIRLAEVYLIRAEARARQIGKESLAQDDLFLVASRGDINAIRSTSSGTLLINEILKERRKELAFEGHQLFDLNRTRTNWTKFRSNDGTTAYTARSNRTIFPIPRRETSLNPNIRQNTGY